MLVHRFRDEGNRLSFALSVSLSRFGRALGGKYGRLLFAFRPRYRRLLLAFRTRDCCLPITFCL